MEKKQLEKLARMILFDVPQNQIAAACNLSESRISQIKATEEYKEVEQQISTEQFEEEQLVNQGWDGIEALGINRVVQHLQTNPEPEFALKAAMVANKAIRRGRHRNNPIAQSAGLRAVINLNQVFVERINNSANKMIDDLSVNKKDSNFLAPSEVQKLLSMDENMEERIIDHSNPITSPMTTRDEDEIMRSLDSLKIDTLT